MKKLVLSVMAGVLFTSVQSLATGPGDIGSGELKTACRAIIIDKDGNETTTDFQFNPTNSDGPKGSVGYIAFLEKEGFRTWIYVDNKNDIVFINTDPADGFTSSLFSSKSLDLSFQKKKDSNEIKFVCETK